MRNALNRLRGLSSNANPTACTTRSPLCSVLGVNSGAPRFGADAWSGDTSLLGWPHAVAAVAPGVLSPKLIASHTGVGSGSLGRERRHGLGFAAGVVGGGKSMQCAPPTGVQHAGFAFGNGARGKRGRGGGRGGGGVGEGRGGAREKSFSRSPWGSSSKLGADDGLGDDAGTVRDEAGQGKYNLRPDPINVLDLSLTERQIKMANRVMRALEACKVHAHFREVFSMDHEPDLHEVRMSKDLRIAYVRYSVMFGSRRIFDKRLGGCLGKLRTAVGSILGTKYCPELAFRYDTWTPHVEAMHAVMDRDAAELGIIPNKDGLWIDWSDTEDDEASEVKTTRAGSSSDSDSGSDDESSSDSQYGSEGGSDEDLLYGSGSDSDDFSDGSSTEEEAWDLPSRPDDGGVDNRNR